MLVKEVFQRLQYNCLEILINFMILTGLSLRMAKLFNHNELEAIKDRKDKFKRSVSQDIELYN